MAEFPAMPIWTDAYLGDTMHLSLEEHGAYLKLLMIAWRTPGCSIPDDDKRVATMLGITPKKWAKLKPVVMQFWETDGSRWTQKKLTKVRRGVEDSKSKLSSAGKAGAKAKHLKTQETGSGDASGDASGNAGGDEHGNQNHNQESSLRSDSPSIDPPHGGDDELPFLEEGTPPGSDTPAEDPPPEDTPPKKAPAKKQRRGTRLELEEPPFEWLSWARSEGHPDPAREWQKFRDYWIAAPGQKGVKLDWQATWRNWIRRALDQGAQRIGPGAQQSGSVDLSRIAHENAREMGEW